MASTTNYSWTTPDDTGLVKDGAANIRTLGSAVDTTLFTALGGAYPGLRLIKKQTIVSGVSSVTVSSAFSSTYENYKILISGGTSSQTTGASLQLGATTSGYKYTLNYVSYGGGNTILSSASATSIVYAGVCITTEGLLMNLDLNSPFLTKKTNMSGFYTGLGESGTIIGLQDSATSYTGFTITPQGGTLTGGTIYVYGYGAS